MSSLDNVLDHKVELQVRKSEVCAKRAGQQKAATAQTKTRKIDVKKIPFIQLRYPG